MNEWINQPVLPLTIYEGFIYKITHVPTGKFYIGKKSFWNNKTLPPLKGRTKKEKERRSKLKGNKRHVRVESDWKKYWGSSKELLADVERYGEQQFEREIVRFCYSKWDMAYWEAKFQFDENVIFRENCYNGILNLRVPKAPKKMRY